MSETLTAYERRYIQDHPTASWPAHSEAARIARDVLDLAQQVAGLYLPVDECLPGTACGDLNTWCGEVGPHLHGAGVCTVLCPCLDGQR